MGNEQTLEKKAATRNGVSRLVFAALSILLEITLIVLLFTVLSRYAEWVNAFTRILALILVLTIYGQHKTSTMKMPWIMLIMALPVAYYALRLAYYNSIHLPSEVGIFLQNNGNFLRMIDRGTAVVLPLAINFGCLALMMFSRKAMYTWAVSIFSLALPVLLLISNIYPA